MKNLIAILAFTFGVILLGVGCKKKDDPKPEPEKWYYYKYDIIDSKGCKIGSGVDCWPPSEMQKMIDAKQAANVEQHGECPH